MAARSLMGRLGRAARRRPHRAVFGDAFYVISAQLWSKGVLYSVSLLMANFLTVDDFASYNYYLITTALVTGYIGLGLPLAATKIVAQIDPVDPDPSMEAIVAVLFLAGLVIVAVLLAAPFYIPLILADEIALAGGWVAAGASASALSVLGQTMMFASRSFRGALPPVIAGSAVFVVGAVAAAAWSDVSLLLAGAVLSPFVSAVCFARLLRRSGTMPRLRHWRSFSAWSLGPVLWVALPALGVSVIAATQGWLVARALLEHRGDAAEFNILAVGSQWLALLLFVPMGLGQAIFPRYLAMARGQGFPVRLMMLPVGLTAAALLLLLPIVTLAAPLLTWLYGGRYDFTPSFLIAVVLTAAAAGAQTLLAQFLMAFKGVGVWFAASAVSLAFCVVLLLVVPPDTAVDALAILGSSYLALLVLGAALVWAEGRRRARSGDRG